MWRTARRRCTRNSRWAQPPILACWTCWTACHGTSSNRTCCWPEHADRARRLAAALRIAAADPPRVVQGDLVERLPELAAEAPADATLVVFHTAVLTYLPPQRRELFAQQVSALPGHWISQEAPAVFPDVTAALPVPVPTGPTGPARFVLALDGRPLAFTSPHGGQVSWFGIIPGRR